MTLNLSLYEIKKHMVPPIWDYFKSFYYSKTLVEPVDLKQVLPTLGCPDDAIVQIAQNITSLPGVQQVLGEPIIYMNTEESKKKSEILKKNGFQILNCRQHKNGSFYDHIGVIEHPDLPNWLIKAGALRTPENAFVHVFEDDQNEDNFPSPHESLLRVVMNQRMRKIIKDYQIDVIIPDEFAVPFRNPHTSDISQSYFVLSQKLNLFDRQNAVAFLRGQSNENQLRYAKTICNFIKKVGFADANFDNFGFTMDGKVAVVDTEPMGLIKEVGDIDKCEGVEKCARLGLYSMLLASKDPGLEVFAEEVRRNYQVCLRNVFSIKKIAASIFCPLLPLAFFVMSLISRIKISKLLDSFYSAHLKRDLNAVCYLKEYHRLINGVLFSNYGTRLMSGEEVRTQKEQEQEFKNKQLELEIKKREMEIQAMAEAAARSASTG